MVVSNSQEMDARFAHLIQPIRDLTRNWNVDIASQLEEYLEEIGTIAITFDGGQTTLNFAEAALLIQGSVCVYSRKVEYLHALVYQVLDLIASKKKLQQAASVDADGNDKDVARGKNQQEEEFLSLDDVKDHKNIDLKGENDTPAKGAHGLPRVTLSLMPLEEGEKGDSRLLSHKGDVLGSRKDFNMNTANIFSRGTLLLDLSHLDLLDLSFRNVPTSTPFTQRMAPMVTVISDDVEEMPIDEGLPLDVSMEDDNNFSVNMPPGNSGTDGVAPETIPDKRDCLRVRQPERNKNIINKMRVHPDEDPWTHLEPHQEQTTDKTFKKKKTYKIAENLDSEETKKRKRNKKALTVPQQRLNSISEFCTKAFYSRAIEFPKNPLKVPTFPEFEELYWKEFKLRQNRLKHERKKLAEQGRLMEMGDFHGEDHDDIEQAEDFADDDVGPPVDFQIPEVSDLGPMHPLDIPDPLDMLNDDDGAVAAGFDDPPIISSYEELVRHHVEGYMASAQQYAQITELSRRVTEWEEKIIPKLQEEEDHGPFDIHKYGSTVLDTLKEKPEEVHAPTPEEVPFRKVCTGRQSYEVCRLFLATLQLANNYNVEISSKGTLSGAIDTMTLKILSTRRHFEELEEYRAPSIDP